MVRPAWCWRRWSSLPSRGAWIEILSLPWLTMPGNVAPLTGSVDRNGPMLVAKLSPPYVAPLAGSVDRNHPAGVACLVPEVAPLAGSVDRNVTSQKYSSAFAVAPLAGSVDRNTYPRDIVIETGGRSPRGERG